MSVLKDRIEAKLRRWGTAVSINGGSGVNALLQELTSAQKSIYLDSAEQSQLTLPAMHAVVGAGVSAAVNDTIALDGRTFTVRKVVKQRLAGEVLCQVLVLG